MDTSLEKFFGLDWKCELSNLGCLISCSEVVLAIVVINHDVNVSLDGRYVLHDVLVASEVELSSRLVHPVFCPVCDSCNVGGGIWASRQE